VSEKYPLHDGEPLADTFAADAAFHMHPDFPTNLLLQDCVLNSDMCIVVSERLKNAVEALAPPLVEYLPVAIIDHKKRKVPQRYFIVHPVDPVDCIDRDASGAEMDEILDPAAIESVQKMVLDPALIPADRSLFRLKHYWGAVVARRDLAEALSKGGFSGLRWLELDRYPEP
jgi:hypothetical protein